MAWKLDGSIPDSTPASPVLMVTIDPSRQLEQGQEGGQSGGLCKKSDLRCLFAE